MEKRAYHSRHAFTIVPHSYDVCRPSSNMFVLSSSIVPFGRDNILGMGERWKLCVSGAGELLRFNHIVCVKHASCDHLNTHFTVQTIREGCRLNYVATCTHGTKLYIPI